MPSLWIHFSRSVGFDSLWPMDCSTPGFSVHHQPLEHAQIHAHQVSDAIQPILSSAVPLPSCLRSFPASGSFPIWNQSVVPCPALTAASLPAYRFLRRQVRWTARRSNQSILKEINPGCSLEGLMLKLKLQYFGHLMRTADSFEKTLMLGKIEGRRRRGWQRMRWLGSITDSMGMGLGGLQVSVMDREACRAAVHGVSKIQTRLSDWTELNWRWSGIPISFRIFHSLLWSKALA